MSLRRSGRHPACRGAGLPAPAGILGPISQILKHPPGEETKRGGWTVDGQGARGKTQAMAHIHDKIDFTVAIFVVFQGRVLLVHHRKLNKWLPLGGHIELDEDPEETLIREVKEETGLEVEFIDSKPSVKWPGTKFIHAPNFIDVHEANPPHKHIALTYFLRAKHGKSVKSDEHTQMRWFSQKDLEKEADQLTMPVKFYGEEAIELIQNT